MKDVSLNLGIEELTALIDYNWTMFNAIPKECYGRMTAAGHTLEVTAKRYQSRARELQNLLDDTWPK